MAWQIMIWTRADVSGKNGSVMVPMIVDPMKTKKLVLMANHVNVIWVNSLVNQALDRVHIQVHLVECIIHVCHIQNFVMVSKIVNTVMTNCHKIALDRKNPTVRSINSIVKNLENVPKDVMEKSNASMLKTRSIVLISIMNAARMESISNVKPKILKALIVFQINGHAMERPTAFHMAMTRTRIYVDKSIIIHVNREYFVIASVWTFKKYAMGIKTVQMVAMNYSVTCARTRPNSLVLERLIAKQTDLQNVFHKE